MLLLVNKIDWLSSLKQCLLLCLDNLTTTQKCTKTLIYSSKVKTLLINLVVIIKIYHQLSFKGCMMTETFFFHNTFTWFRTWAPVASLKFEKISQLHVLQIELNDHISIMILVKLGRNHTQYRTRRSVTLDPPWTSTMRICKMVSFY